jgi:phage virion morphogenesis protein
MADPVITVNINELKRLADRLNSYMLSGADRADLLNQMGGVVKSQTINRFNTKIDPEGNTWKAVAESTREYLDRYVRGADPPLVRGGYLQGSIKSVLESADAVLVGSTMKYAEFHQEGTSKMKARKFLGLSTDNIDELDSVIEKFLKRKMG